tara:strand:- start:1398 stop:1934 length:537 start_codon:yes stop_codon:yes gene_type:complete
MREFSSVGLNTGYLLFLVSLILYAINMSNIIDDKFSIRSFFSSMSETNIILFSLIVIVLISFSVNKLRVSSYGIIKELYFMPFVSKKRSWSQIKYYADVDEKYGGKNSIEKVIWFIDFNDRVCLRLKKSKRKNLKKVLDVIAKFEDKYVDNLEINYPYFMRRGWTRVTYYKKIENDKK